MNLFNFDVKKKSATPLWIMNDFTYFLPFDPQRAEASLEHAQRLNPMVEVMSDTQSADEKSDEFFTKFDVVCATCCKQSTLLRINKVCSDHKVKFFGGDVYGFYGYMFADLGEHEFAE